MKARIHPRQDQRVAALRSYDILDTEREKDFDDIVALASEICGAPISVVNLIDTDRQWFKAEVGLGLRETPLETSLCSHAILEDSFVEIPDTLGDPRMADNPLCASEPGLRFYAGALLVGEDGLPLGTLCVLDFKPRTLSALQRRTLSVLARQVVKQLELRRALRRAAILRQEVDHRIKNSLQSVAALTRLQARGASTPEVRAALDTVVQRIETVADIHEQLYTTQSDDAIDFDRYLSRLVEAARALCRPDVSISADIAPIRLGARRAAAAAVVVNEFIQNATKHAFPEGRAGVITITGRATGRGDYVLRLADDGIGFAVDHQRPGGLGIPVIEASAAQLDGTYRHVPADRGTVGELRFAV